MSRLLPPPSLFVTQPVMEKNPSSELTPTRLGFPNEFPYEFDSQAFSPGFTSSGGSTDTEDETSDDEEDFLAGLTRRLAPSTQRLPPPSFNTKPEEKRQVSSTSPQSTLSGLGSFSSSRSESPNLLPPPASTASLRRDNAWEVISAAAGEVARLKLGSQETHLPRQKAQNPNPSPILPSQNAAFQTDHYLQQQRLLDQMWLCSQPRIKPAENLAPRRLVNDDVSLEKLRYMRHIALSNSKMLSQHAGAPPKRPSAGTGVFLPRQYPSKNPSETLKKPVMVNTTPMSQSRVKPQQSLNFDEFINVGSGLSQFDYECMLARRRQLLARQGNYRAAVNGVGCLNQERLLPQDWMY